MGQFGPFLFVFAIDSSALVNYKKSMILEYFVKSESGI